jgi:hypothetical protein
MLNDEIKKKVNFLKNAKVNKIAIKKMMIKFDKKKLDDENVKGKSF